VSASFSAAGGLQSSAFSPSLGDAFDTCIKTVADQVGAPAELARDDVQGAGVVDPIVSKLKELEKRLRDEPENLGLRVMVAGAMRETGRHDEAVELYRSVAIAYRDQGRSQQAIAVCRSILEIAPTTRAVTCCSTRSHRHRPSRRAGRRWRRRRCRAPCRITSPIRRRTR